jgi:hypothetical protein
MDTEKMREEFESWWEGRDLPDSMKAAFYMVWKASRASIVIELSPGDCFSPNDCGDLAIWRDDAKRLFEAAGLTVKE